MLISIVSPELPQNCPRIARIIQNQCPQNWFGGADIHADALRWSLGSEGRVPRLAQRWLYMSTLAHA